MYPANSQQRNFEIGYNYYNELKVRFESLKKKKSKLNKAHSEQFDRIVEAMREAKKQLEEMPMMMCERCGGIAYGVGLVGRIEGVCLNCLKKKSL